MKPVFKDVSIYILNKAIEFLNIVENGKKSLGDRKNKH